LKHAHLRKLSEQSEAAARRLTQVYDSYLLRKSTSTAKPKKRKGKKHTQPVANTEEPLPTASPIQTREAQIAELEKAIGELEGEILPSLQDIETVAHAEKVESFPTEFAMEKPILKATELIENLKV